MPSAFRRRPSARRQPLLTASQLVLGDPATDILHRGRTAHLLRASSKDHHARYREGRRLAVKEMVPGPTTCHVILTDVLGPAQKFTLKDVDFRIARELGHVRLSDFQRHWVLNHDPTWMGQRVEDGTDTEEAIAGRFEKRWHKQGVWLLRFRLATITEAPRLLAARPSSYDPRREHADARDEDIGYVTSAARALPEEMPALTEAEWVKHVGPESPFRRAERLAAQRADRESKTIDARLQWAVSTARQKGYDIRDERRRFDRLMGQGKVEKAMRQLDLIEQRVFPVAA